MPYFNKKLYLCSLKKNVAYATPNLYMGQLQEKYKSYREPQKFMEMGVYPYFAKSQASKARRLLMSMGIKF